MKQMIRLRGISGEIKGKVWEHDSLMRAGRLNSLEIVLDDSSVSRQHAELHVSGQSGHVHNGPVEVVQPPVPRHSSCRDTSRPSGSVVEDYGARLSW